MDKRASALDLCELRGVWLIAIVMGILLAALVFEHRGQRGRVAGPVQSSSEIASE